MVMDMLPPPGLEGMVTSAAAAPQNRPYPARDLSSWHLAQANVQLMRQNMEISAQIALIRENAALAQANVRLVEQLRHLAQRSRKCELDPGQPKVTVRLEAPSDTASTSAASLDEYSSEADEERTTVMMRNIPKEYTRAMLLDLLDQQGFLGSYDLLYLPAEFHTEFNYGYAFINLTTKENVIWFRGHFNGFSDWIVPSDRVCEISWSDAAQGLDDNVRRYRDSSIMHESVEDRFKPVLYENGQRIPFPEPTKTIKPHRRKRGVFPRSD